MTHQDALARIEAAGDPAQAAALLDYHKAERRYLGTPGPVLDALAKEWRAELALPDRLDLAAALWDSNIHEARMLAAKLLTQARIRPEDDGAWQLILGWVPQLDAWALADAVAGAAQKRLVADPARMEDASAWVLDPLLWARRCALVATLPFAKLNHPKPAEHAAREQALDWAGSLTGDRDWFIQKAIADWLRILARHDAPRAQAFLNEHGPYLRPFSRKEAEQALPPSDRSPSDTAPSDSVLSDSAPSDAAETDPDLPDPTLPDPDAPQD